MTTTADKQAIRAEARAIRQAINHLIYVNTRDFCHAEWQRLVAEYTSACPTDSPITRAAREEAKKVLELHYSKQPTLRIVTLKTTEVDE